VQVQQHVDKALLVLSDSSGFCRTSIIPALGVLSIVFTCCCAGVLYLQH
jgi:hypothetical protein